MLQVSLCLMCSCHQRAHQQSLLHSDNSYILLHQYLLVRACGQFSPVHALVQGGKIELGAPTGRWQMIVVYRGKHCPVSKNYLASLQQIYYELDELGVEVIAVSGDGRERAEAFVSSHWPHSAHLCGVAWPRMSISQVREASSMT